MAIPPGTGTFLVEGYIDEGGEMIVEGQYTGDAYTSDPFVLNSGITVCANTGFYLV